jgi:hypothetical protein
VATQALPQRQFLLVAANLIHRCLLAPSRAEAKQRFRSLESGQLLALPPIEMEDKTHARFGLAFDHSEFVGKLNFSAFRSSLEVLLANLVQQIKAEQDLKTFSAQEQGEAMIFGVTGVTVDGGQPNVMVLGSEPDARGDATILRLMYLDPEQFAPQAVTAATSASPSQGV